MRVRQGVLVALVVVRVDMHGGLDIPVMVDRHRVLDSLVLVWVGRLGVVGTLVVVRVDMRRVLDIPVMVDRHRVLDTVVPVGTQEVLGISAVVWVDRHGGLDT